MDMTQVWEVVYLLLDVLGVVAFSLLFLFMLPKTKTMDSALMAMALIKAGAMAMFFWLFLIDLAAHLNIPALEWLSLIPYRGIGLRVLLLIPGWLAVYRFIR